MKRLYAVWLFIGLCCLAIDFPPVRNPNLVFIHILPEETGKEVVLEFDKCDVNGYVGTDAIVLTVISPSGKNVCEVALPDDGSEKNDWQPGPRQRVVLRFNADEEGEYMVNSNSFSSVDISYAFDQAASKNATWGLTLKKPRLLHGKLHLFMVAAPRAIGEKQELVMLVENAKWTSIADFQCLEDGLPLMEPYTHKTKTEKRLDDLRFPLLRNSREGIVEIKASDFAECSWRFVGYSDFILCTDLRSAQRFRTFHNHHFFSGSHVEFKTPQTADRFAFAPKGAYRVTFLPDKEGDAFQFAAYVLGKKHDIAPGAESFEFTMPEGTPYIEWDWSAAPNGRVLVQTVTAEPEILQPESGSVWSQKTPPLLWTPAAGATAYTVTLTHQDGKQLSLEAKGNSLGWDAFVSRLSPGIWEWKVSAEGKIASPEKAAFFAIPQRDDTSLAYLWGQQPAMDSLVDETPSQLSCRISGKSLDDIDWKATVWNVNGKSLMARPADSNRIEAIMEPDCFLNGRNSVTLRVTDRHGNFQMSSWCFDVKTAVPRVLSHDSQGRIQMNGRFFYPIIYYGYKGKTLKLEEIGFNTHLTNGFSNQAQLDNYLLRNLKLLDAGCSFKESPLETVRQYATSPIARHSARLGMWCDELDVHRPQEWIRDYLALFSKNDAWRGVCSCNLSLYGKMAEYGDYLMVDSYVYDSARLFRIDNAFAMARTAAGDKPLLALVCGFSNEDPKLVPFMPTVKDVEYQLYAALRHGVNGIGLYQCGPYRMEVVPELWTQVTETLRRFSAISFIAAGKDVTAAVRVIASSGTPRHRAFRIENRLYLVIQNSSFTPDVFHIGLFGDIDAPVKVLQENRVICMKEGVFSDVFQGAATHCYVLERK